ncbi:MAG: FCD domain-containing protein [Dongiaceae bacterium]
MTRRNEVLQRLRELIAGDNYPPGRRLPPERELAEEMAVSRGALRRALAILEGEGLVWRHVGKGTFTGLRPESAAGPALVGSSLHSAESVLEVRSILEPAVARIAAERASSTDLARMKSHLQAAQNSADTETFNLHCDMLHRSIARATHNAILLRLYDALSPIRALAHAVGEDAELTPAEMASYWREHADIIEAINTGDAGAAETAMKRHIKQVWSDTPDTIWRNPEPSSGNAAAIPPQTALETALFRPTLLELADRFGETAFLAVLRDREIEIVDVMMPRSRSQMSMHPGFGPRPIGSCPSAQAILAFQPATRSDAIIEAVLEDTGDRAALRRDLVSVREAGFARADEVLEAGTYSLAVPVGLDGGAVRFSVGLIGAKGRMLAVPDRIYVDGIKHAIDNTVGRLGDVLSALKPYLAGGDSNAPLPPRA